MREVIGLQRTPASSLERDDTKSVGFLGVCVWGIDTA